MIKFSMWCEARKRKNDNQPGLFDNVPEAEPQEPGYVKFNRGVKDDLQKKLPPEAPPETVQAPVMARPSRRRPKPAAPQPESQTRVLPVAAKPQRTDKERLSDMPPNVQADFQYRVNKGLPPEARDNSKPWKSKGRVIPARALLKASGQQRDKTFTVRSMGRMLQVKDLHTTSDGRVVGYDDRGHRFTVAQTPTDRIQFMPGDAGDDAIGNRFGGTTFHFQRA